MSRTSIASFAIGALAVGLVAAGTAYAVIGPDDTRVVAPVSVNAANTGTSRESGTDPDADLDTSSSPSSGPSSSPSPDDNGDSGKSGKSGKSNGRSDKGNDDSGRGNDDSDKGGDDDSGTSVSVPEGITVDRARAIALGVKVGTVRETKLDDENGRTVWDVEVTGADGASWEITIDAVSGDVVKTERD